MNLPSATARSTVRVLPVTIRSAAAAGSFSGTPMPRAKSFPVPAGITPNGIPDLASTCAPRWIVPSPPISATASAPEATTSAEILPTSSAHVVA
jgi:hypothetical protein